MPRQHDERPAIPKSRPQVRYLSERHWLQRETGRLQTHTDQFLATGIVGRHRRPTDQFAGKVKRRFIHWHHPDCEPQVHVTLVANKSTPTLIFQIDGGRYSWERTGSQKSVNMHE